MNVVSAGPSVAMGTSSLFYQVPLFSCFIEHYFSETLISVSSLSTLRNYFILHKIPA